ncbi:hypothetical protein [Methylobacterium durans]|uniref:Uncharacterized protein n=1 Tax=Methylobacterium durans TaxID=2202825 RepID=A0A2U8W9U1_9HYPH|nr:hypothetical protein [Methylobacterium durans]AWN42378.1 hypothetical protein DK389_20105 [Methylobacterium durans]
MPITTPDPEQAHARRVWLEREHEHLVQANQLLADWKRRVLDQMIIVEDLRAKGYDTALAEALLETMQRTLEEGRRHQQLILEALSLSR